MKSDPRNSGLTSATAAVADAIARAISSRQFWPDRIRMSSQGSIS